MNGTTPHLLRGTITGMHYREKFVVCPLETPPTSFDVEIPGLLAGRASYTTESSVVHCYTYLPAEGGALPPDPLPPEPGLTFTLVDLRPEHDLSKIKNNDPANPSRYRESPRDEGSVHDICIHQWATDVGTTSANREKYGAAGALARRGQETVYHLDAGAIDGEGVVSIVHPSVWYMYAQHKANAPALGIGVMGSFPRFEADHNATHTDMSAELASAIEGAVTHAVEMIREFGHAGAIRVITHSQYTSKPADPGEWVMKAVGRVVARLGLVTDPDHAQDGGEPWPSAWRA